MPDDPLQQIVDHPGFKGLPLPEAQKALLASPTYSNLVKSSPQEAQKFLNSVYYGPAPTPASGDMSVGSVLSGIAAPIQGMGKTAIEQFKQPINYVPVVGPMKMAYQSLVQPQIPLIKQAGQDVLQTIKNPSQASPLMGLHIAEAGLPVAGPMASDVEQSSSAGKPGEAIGKGLTYSAMMAGPKAIDYLKASPVEAATKGYNSLIQSVSAGRPPDFADHIQNLSDAGHMRELATQFEPQTVKEAADGLRVYKNNWENKTIGPAVTRHPEATISGDAIATEVNSLRNPALDKLFPENSKVIDAEIARYAGQQIPLSEVAGPGKLLARLNAMSRAVQNMSPENKAAAESASIAKAVIDKTTQGVRNQLYDTLDSLGEPNIRKTQSEFGSMQELQGVLDKNISRAELAEARKPGYKGIVFRAIQRHPLLSGGMLLGSEYLGTPAPLAALPAIEALRTFSERANTPNAMLRKAMSHFSRGPELK